MAKEYKYYLPKGDFELYEWCLNFTTIAETYAATWNLPVAGITALKSENSVYKSYLDQAYSEMATKPDIRRKNSAHVSLTAHIQDYVNINIKYNKLIDDDARADLGTHVPDRTRTPGKAPEEHVGFKAEPKAAMQLRLDFWVLETGKKAKPDNDDGAVFALKKLEEGEAVPTETEQLTVTDRFTRTPHVLTFAEADRGKRIAIAARWQNAHGKGPWSVIQVVVIP